MRLQQAWMCQAYTVETNENADTRKKKRGRKGSLAIFLTSLIGDNKREKVVAKIDNFFGP